LTIVDATHQQARKSRDKLEEQMSGLREIIEAAEDRVFDAFCRRLKIANIREYEGRQLKLAQEESDARLRYSTQIARLKTQYGICFLSTTFADTSLG
jgi:structural maintenance of chromosome 1